MKAVIVIVLVLVLAALASAGLFMLRKTPRGDDDGAPDARMARALAMRIGLSIALFLFILLSWWMGWIQPTGLPTGR